MDAIGAFGSAHPMWVWLAIGAIFLTIEVLTGSGWLLWPAGSAALVAVVCVVAPQFGGLPDMALFTACTVVSTFVGRRWLRNQPQPGPDVNDPGARLLGHRGEASHAFDGGLGRVFIDGKEWSAELDGADTLPAGARVEVIAVLGGARLRVRAA
jgi:membrane protein implicated in regulation of membrane protease activity